MPELPEVETVCKGLLPAMRGQRIRRIETRRRDLRIPFPKNLRDIEGDTVTDITRRAKYILIHFKSGQVMIVHLGMSGRMTVHEKNKTVAAQKHDHMVITLGNGTVIVFNDPRRFGLVDLAMTKTIGQHRFFKSLGPEPLDKSFTAGVLQKKLQGKKIAVKVAVMDQRVVVGVGNIYASESLFMADINPRRAAGTLSLSELKKLTSAIKAVLKKAIAAGGSTLRDYAAPDGELGYFQHAFAVYDHAGEKCRGCRCDIKKTGGIQRLTQGGRSTFYCPVKQN